MNAKIMEGLVGASANANLLNTPMRVFREARRRGDTATMERAMGYAGEFVDRAEEYKTKVDVGMEEDAREAREKAELEREEAIRKRKEEREEMEAGIVESKKGVTSADTVEISEEGRILLKDHTDLDSLGSSETKTDAVKEPATYTKAGEAVPAGQGTGISVFV